MDIDPLVEAELAQKIAYSGESLHSYFLSDVA